jgi:acyl carrier protein
LKTLKESGAKVKVAKVDIANQDQVAKLIEDVNSSMPKLRGIIHAAGILDDGTLIRLDQNRVMNVMKPKVSGSWNLHALSLNEALDFFILFSSAASVLGSPGQGNYSAANAFLDALAHYRNSRNLPALSINWGPWSDVGLAAVSGREDRLILRGLETINPEQGLDILGKLDFKNVQQVTVMPIDFQEWGKSYPVAAERPFLDIVLHERADYGQLKEEKGNILEIIIEARDEDRQILIEGYLQKLVAHVLRISSSKIGVNQSLSSIGLDSLMAIELKNRVVMDLGVEIPLTKILRGSSIIDLASQIFAKLTEMISAHIVSMASVDA